MKTYISRKFIDSDEFITEMLAYGKPLEISLVGSFENNGRGSRRDIELPLHRDGDYSTSFKDRIDIVGLYCIKSGEAKTILELPDARIKTFTMKERDSLIFDNALCRHGRSGPVKDRLLLRIWISKNN
ncbi:MAG: hypothetical protein CBC29_06085 [Methylococcaceae bacterium TMED69]|nr:MAG: hypothetical protein CBC29_06085 [Methylococcaceae bacterium TMED69]